MDMAPNEIRAMMVRENVTETGIAESLNPPVTQPAVNRVIYGLSTSDRIQRAIADAIHIDVKKIWPSIYIVQGGPRKPGRPRIVQDLVIQ